MSDDEISVSEFPREHFEIGKYLTETLNKTTVSRNVINYEPLSMYIQGASIVNSEHYEDKYVITLQYSFALCIFAACYLDVDTFQKPDGFDDTFIVKHDVSALSMCTKNTFTKKEILYIVKTFFEENLIDCLTKHSNALNAFKMRVTEASYI